MKLKDSTQRPWLLAGHEPLRLKWMTVIAVVLGYSLLLLALGAYAYQKGSLREIGPLITQNVSMIPKVIRGRLARPEHLTIDIKHEDYMQLASMRQTALDTGILVTSSEDYVPATIRHGDRTIKVRLRLKGDLPDHWESAKWSLRIRVAGENTLLGMKEFSIQHPRTRSYLYEWLYHQALKREGLPSLRYEFVSVTINGKDMGIYALEEHFEKRLVENSQLREGPIVRFNEDLCWADILQQAQVLGRLEVLCSLYGSGSYLSSATDGFQTQKWLSDAAGRSQYMKAIQLLESFRRGEVKTSEAFDVVKLAKYMAVTDLMGARHAVNWRNARFYYNPITSRLEPIGFDAFGQGEPPPIRSLVSTLSRILPSANDNEYYYHQYYFDAIFSDMAFYEEYIRQLELISSSPYLDELFAELDDQIEKNLDILYRDYPDVSLSKGIFYKNQRFIKTVLNPEKGLHAYFHDASANRIRLQVGNIQYLPIQVLSVSYKDTMVYPAERETILAGRDPSQPVDYRDMVFALPNGLVWSDEVAADSTINYRILGTSQVRSETVLPWSPLDANLAYDDFIRQTPNASSFEFLAIDEAEKRIFVKPGIWDLGQNLIIPEGYRVIASEGTQLDLSSSAKILSYSPLEFIGSADNPIIIQSTDSTGQGIIVMDASQASILEYVTFTNLANPSHGGWELTGAITFYESAVTISHVEFMNNRSEDALNIVRSDFTINQTLFSHTFADAFDADFTTGKVTNTSFVASGNDAIDVSGSVIELENIFIDGAGDKGISVGEHSQVNARRIVINNAVIGVAGKDLSEIAIEDVTVTASDIGLAVYQKKPEFGPAAINASEVEISNTDIPYLVEEQSVMVADGIEIEDGGERVRDILSQMGVW